MRNTLYKTDIALELFRRAEAQVLDSKFAWEIEWQRQRKFSQFSEQDLLRESAWVILNSGFRESVVRKKFNYLSLCFCDWESADLIVRFKHECLSTALASFRHERKLQAIWRIADLIDTMGFDRFRSIVINDPISELCKLPFIGPITSFHLAKNLGLDVAKNDRHLANIADYCGYPDAHELCDFLSDETGTKRSVVDIILWRSATLGEEIPYVA